MSSGKDKPGFLFGEDEGTLWKEEWKGMPEFHQEDQTPWKTLPVHFENETDMRKFAELVDQKIYPTTRSIWFPEAEIGYMVTKRFVDES